VQLEANYKDLCTVYAFEKENVLGAGCFGTVFKGRDKETDFEVAIKMINKQKLKQDEIVSLRKEVRIMQNLNHPHVVKYLEAYEDNKKLYLVMGMCTEGDLETMIEKVGKENTGEMKGKGIDEIECSRILGRIL
jgi:serine/threonine protein kinase